MCSSNMCDCRIYDAVCNSMMYRDGEVNCYVVNGNVYIIIVVLTFCCIVVCVCVCACWLDFMVLYILI
jgi:hypothetical protein